MITANDLDSWVTHNVRHLCAEGIQGPLPRRLQLFDQWAQRRRNVYHGPQESAPMRYQFYRIDNKNHCAHFVSHVLGYRFGRSIQHLNVAHDVSR